MRSEALDGPRHCVRCVQSSLEPYPQCGQIVFGCDSPGAGVMRNLDLTRTRCLDGAYPREVSTEQLESRTIVGRGEQVLEHSPVMNLRTTVRRGGDGSKPVVRPRMRVIYRLCPLRE